MTITLKKLFYDYNFRIIIQVNTFFQKFSKHYDLNVISNGNGRFLQLDTTDKSILDKTNKLVSRYSMELNS